MHHLAIDAAAWSSRWRERAVGDKALLSLGLVLCALILPAWPGSVLVGVVAVVAAVGGAGTPTRLLVRSMAAPALFIVIGAVSVAITLRTSPGWSVGITRASLGRAAEVSGHAAAGSLAVLLLAVSTPMVDILSGLRRARVPNACVEVAGLIYRMLFVLMESLGTILQTQTARLGYSTARRSMASAGSLTAAVLSRSWERARRLEQGLAGRDVGDAVPAPGSGRPSSGRFVSATLAVLVGLVAVTFAVTGTVLR